MENQIKELTDPVQNGIGSLVSSLLSALREHDAAGCAQLFTDDARLLSPYGPEVRGRSGIEATHKEWFEEGETNKRIELLDCGASGSIGFCIVAYAGDYPQADGSSVTESGTSVNVLKRQPDGGWKIHISSLNSDDPPLAD